MGSFGGKLAAWGAGLAGVGAVLYRFPPARYGVYPACPIHALTGLLCPGCGATRALGALLHGRLGEAMHWNALFVCLLLPAAAGYGVLAMRRGGWVRVPGAVWGGLAVVMAGFTVWRNV